MRKPRHALQNAYSIGKTFHFLDKRRSSSIPGGTRISIRFWFHVLLEHKEQESRCICPGTPPGHDVYGNTLCNALSNFIFRRLRRRRRTLNDNSTSSWHCRVVWTWTLLRFRNSRDTLSPLSRRNYSLQSVCLRLVKYRLTAINWIKFNHVYLLPIDATCFNAYRDFLYTGSYIYLK